MKYFFTLLLFVSMPLCAMRSIAQKSISISGSRMISYAQEHKIKTEINTLKKEQLDAQFWLGTYGSLTGGCTVVAAMLAQQADIISASLVALSAGYANSQTRKNLHKYQSCNTQIAELETELRRNKKD